MLEHVVQLMAQEARDVAGQLLGAHPSIWLRQSCHVVDSFECRLHHGVEVILHIVRDDGEVGVHAEEVGQDVAASL